MPRAKLFQQKGINANMLGKSVKKTQEETKPSLWARRLEVP